MLFCYKIYDIIKTIWEKSYSDSPCKILCEHPLPFLIQRYCTNMHIVYTQVYTVIFPRIVWWTFSMLLHGIIFRVHSISSSWQATMFVNIKEVSFVEHFFLSLFLFHPPYHLPSFILSFLLPSLPNSFPFSFPFPPSPPPPSPFILAPFPPSPSRKTVFRGRLIALCLKLNYFLRVNFQLAEGGACPHSI